MSIDLAAAVRSSARLEEWNPAEPLLGLVAEALHGVAGPNVAIVSRTSDHPLRRVLSSAVPTVETLSLATRQAAPDRHLLLTAHGPMDLIVDLAGGPGAERRFAAQLFHLKPGGTLLCRIPKRGDLLGYVQGLQRLRQSADLQPPTSGRDERRMPERDRHAIASSLRCLEVHDGFVLAVNEVATLAKVRESQMNRYLDLRPDVGEILQGVPGAQLASRCELRTSAEEGPPFAAPSAYDAPDLALRRYSDVTCLPRQAAFHDNVVLPATYRHNAKVRLRNNALVEWGHDFVRRPDVEPALLDGAFFYLDNQHRGHFGHALTEQVSQMWGWRRSKATFPGLRALLFERPAYPVADWEYRLLAAAGIHRDEVHVAKEPVTAESLVVASPMFSMPNFVHPEIRRTYLEIGDVLEREGTIDNWPARVFCSRRGRRSAHNKDEIERTFVDAGFQIVYPEELPLGDQIRLVRRTEVIAGFAGSGMFQIAFSARPKHVILVGSESYTGSNEYMIASVLGHRLDLVLCRPDVPRQGRFTPSSYHSNFTYDPQREGRFLKRVLAEL